MKNSVLYVGILIGCLFLAGCQHARPRVIGGRRPIPPEVRNRLPPNLRNLSDQTLDELALQDLAGNPELLRNLDQRLIEQADPLLANELQNGLGSPFWKKALGTGASGIFTPEDEQRLRQQVFQSPQALIPHYKMETSADDSLRTVRSVSDAIRHRDSDTHQ